MGFRKMLKLFILETKIIRSSNFLSALRIFTNYAAVATKMQRAKMTAANNAADSAEFAADRSNGAYIK